MNKIIVIGTGIVGGATMDIFKKFGYDVSGYDTDKKKQKELAGEGYSMIDDITSADIYFVCTHEKYVENIVKNLNSHKGLIVIRSTILPMVCENLQNRYDRHICHLPEFLREYHTEHDIFFPARIVIGECCKEHGDVLENLFKNLNAPIVRTDTKTSAMIKYASNCWLATQISYWNFIHQISEYVGVNSLKITKSCILDHRISKYGTIPGRAYGGKCLPKDMDAFIDFVCKIGNDAKILKSVREVNEEIRMLLKDTNGSYKCQKTFEHHNIEDVICVKGKKEEKYTIGVIGTGLTGKGIVEVAVKTGNRVIFKSRSEKTLEKAIETISKNLSKGMELEEFEFALSRITTTTHYEPLVNADLIIESVVENLQVKKEIFHLLDSLCSPDMILASNTSSLSISDIAEDLEHPERVIGMHFFNPILKMKLVEIIKGEKTSEDSLKKAHEFVAKFNKVSVDGFTVNRLLFIMINEACHMLDERVANVEDIDKAMKLGANHPMGPFELSDSIGLDICLEIIENFNTSFGGNTFKPSTTLKTLVKEGRCGRKTGRGFYEYPSLHLKSYKGISVL